jgi:hypothetical protein
VFEVCCALLLKLYFPKGLEKTCAIFSMHRLDTKQTTIVIL